MSTLTVAAWQATPISDALFADVISAMEAEFDEGKAVTPGGRVGDDSPLGTPGNRPNWIDKTGGLPKYIREVAHALVRHGHSKSRAISIAVATMKRWAAGAGHVSKKVQAAAAAAVAQWEAMRAAARGTSA